MKSICIIPARGGSKRIKNKNIKNFFGKPLIYYSIKAAIKSNIFDKIIVSTDSKKIASIAKKYGAEVPFLRSKKLSTDKVITDLVLLDVINNLKSQNYKIHACIYPTAPLIKGKDLIKAYKRLLLSKADSIFGVTKFDYPIDRALYKKNNFFHFKENKNKNKRSQDLKEYFHDSGSFYLFKTKNFLKNKTIITNKSLGYYLNKIDSCDIDDEEDLQLAKLLYRFKK